MEHFDAVIKNGMLMNYKTLEFSKGSVFIKKGKIVSPITEEWDSPLVIDAKKNLVLPGIIDEHTHVNYQGSNLGISADILCPSNGITTTVDGGSTGCDNFDLFYAANINRYATHVLSYLNISSYGIECPFHREENLDPRDVNVEGIEEKFEKYSNVLKGLKIRLDKTTLGESDSLESLEKCLSVSELLQNKGFHCPVVVHVANLPDALSIESILTLLRKGDVFTHVFQNRGDTIYDNKNNIKSCVISARKRGVLFDACNGRIHWSFKNQESALASDFFPDIISSDTVLDGAFIPPGCSLVHAMNTFLASGFDESVIIKAVTQGPAESLGQYPQLGSLNSNENANISIFKLDEISPIKLFDRWGEERVLNRYFKPMLTMVKGKIVFRQIDF